jgi:hypothetical protein
MSAHLIAAKAWRSQTLAGSRLLVEAANVDDAEALAQDRGLVADIVASGRNRFDILVVGLAEGR